MAPYSEPIIDLDVHHLWTHPDEVIQYLPKEWHEYAQAYPRRRLIPGYSTVSGVSNRARLIGSVEPGGGTLYETMRRHIDANNTYRCLLTHDSGQYGAQLNTPFGTALCSAVNDWNIDRWLNRDERFYSLVVINPVDPAAAATEIRRVGRHPRIVGVLLAGNQLGRAFGDPLYDPIHAAAADLGLHLVLHFGGTSDRPGAGIAMSGGHAGNSVVKNSQFSQQGMHYLSSFISNGVFERYPSLKVLVLEYGVAWIPYVMFRLDQYYDILRMESQWVKKLPSEYVLEHVKFGTQPLELSPSPKQLSPKQLVQLLQTVDGIEELLCFATDWPHSTADDPNFIGRLLPQAWHRKVFTDNACRFFGWPAPSQTHPLTAVAQ